MNRRSFFKSILVAGASFTILPGAGRIWKAQRDIPLFPSYGYDQMPGNLYDFLIWSIRKDLNDPKWGPGDNPLPVLWEVTGSLMCGDGSLSIQPTKLTTTGRPLPVPLSIRCANTGL